MIARLKHILKMNGLNGEWMANKMGLRYSSYRTLTRTSAKTVPMWIQTFLIGYDFHKEHKEIKASKWLMLIFKEYDKPIWVKGFLIGYDMAKNEEKLKNIEVDEEI